MFEKNCKQTRQLDQPSNRKSRQIKIIMTQKRQNDAKTTKRQNVTITTQKRQNGKTTKRQNGSTSRKHCQGWQNILQFFNGIFIVKVNFVSGLDLSTALTSLLTVLKGAPHSFAPVFPQCAEPTL